MAKKAKGTSKQALPAQTSKHFSHKADYQRLVFVLQNSKSNKEAAEKIGVSERTIRRWKTFGVPNKSEHKKDITKVARNIRRRLSNIPPSLQPDPRPLFYYRTFGGVRTKYYIVAGLSYETILNIITDECKKGIYSAYAFLLKFEIPFTGVWTGAEAFDVYDIDAMTAKERRQLRDAGSWVSVTEREPYLSTRLMPVIKGRCDPDDFAEDLSHYFGLNYTKIYEVRFKEWRALDNDEE